MAAWRARPFIPWGTLRNTGYVISGITGNVATLLGEIRGFMRGDDARNTRTSFDLSFHGMDIKVEGRLCVSRSPSPPSPAISRGGGHGGGDAGGESRWERKRAEVEGYRIACSASLVVALVRKSTVSVTHRSSRFSSVSLSLYSPPPSSPLCRRMLYTFNVSETGSRINSSLVRHSTNPQCVTFTQRI